MKSGNNEFTVYEVCIWNIDSWDDENKVYDEISPANVVRVYCSRIFDALILYETYLKEVKNEQVITLNAFDIGVEEADIEDFVMEVKTYEEEYGDFTRYGYAVTIEDYYIHEDAPYKGASEVLEYMVIEKTPYFNMKMICKKAGVSYSTFRNFRGKFQPMSDDKLHKILDAMSQVGGSAWSDELEKRLEYIKNF